MAKLQIGDKVWLDSKGSTPEEKKNHKEHPGVVIGFDKYDKAIIDWRDGIKNWVYQVNGYQIVRKFENQVDKMFDKLKREVESG